MMAHYYNNSNNNKNTMLVECHEEAKPAKHDSFDSLSNNCLNNCDMNFF